MKTLVITPIYWGKGWQAPDQQIIMDGVDQFLMGYSESRYILGSEHFFVVVPVTASCVDYAYCTQNAFHFCEINARLATKYPSHIHLFYFFTALIPNSVQHAYPHFKEV